MVRTLAARASARPGDSDRDPRACGSLGAASEESQAGHWHASSSEQQPAKIYAGRWLAYLVA